MMQEPAGETTCLPSVAGKMHESFSRTTDTRATKLLECIHADISGIEPKTKCGHKYFLLLVDNYTRYYWSYLLQTKETTEVVLILRQSRAVAETEKHTTGDCINTSDQIMEWEFSISL